MVADFKSAGDGWVAPPSLLLREQFFHGRDSTAMMKLHAKCHYPEDNADLVIWLLTRRENIKTGIPVLI
jgi:hypothetical protein